MAGNKHPWRDVISVAAWQEVLSITKNDPSRATGNLAVLSAIGMKLKTYHTYPKTQRSQFLARRRALEELAGMAERYLQDKHKIYQKPGGSKGQPFNPRRIAANNTNIAPTVSEKSIDRWIYSLARRARKKAAYLELLDQYITDSTAPLGGFTAFQQHLQQLYSTAPVTAPELLGLAPGVEPEAWDPWHRPIEVRVDLQSGNVLAGAGNAMSQAFVKWYTSGSTEHFLVWLEGQEICTFSKYFEQWKKGRGPLPLDVSIIQYSPNPQVRQVFLAGGQLYARPLASVGASKLLTTATNGTKPGEAYVWLASGELLIHIHMSGSFHHSSFSGGSKVRCAGTIDVRQGKVTRLDNNSGHYKPSTRHYLTLLQVLQSKGVLDPAVQVSTHDIQASDLQDFQQKASSANLQPFKITNGAMTQPFYA